MRYAHGHCAPGLILNWFPYINAEDRPNFAIMPDYLHSHEAIQMQCPIMPERYFQPSWTTGWSNSAMYGYMYLARRIDLTTIDLTDNPGGPVGLTRLATGR